MPPRSRFNSMQLFSITKEMKLALRDEAIRRNISVAELIRQIINTYLQGEKK